MCIYIYIYIYIYICIFHKLADNTRRKKEIYKEKQSYKGGMHIDYVQT